MTIQITVPIEPDEQGMIGRECPRDECGLYFKVRLETGRDTEKFCCPYCRIEGHIRHFTTKAQLEYLGLVAGRKVLDPMMRDFKRDAERLNRNQRGGLIQIKFSVDYRPAPILPYLERQLETEVHCDNCAFEFSVYGVFASCPCCGRLNALKVLLNSLETAKKKLKLSDEPSLEIELRQDFVKDALTGSVSAFDAYGKALMNRSPTLFSKARPNIFQDIEGLNGYLNDQKVICLEEVIDVASWEEIKWFFQARHLYVHNAGVIDARFVSKQPAFNHMIGRILPLDSEQLHQVIDKLADLCRKLDNCSNNI